MKKLSTLLSLSMTACLLLTACADTNKIDDNVPEIEDLLDEDLTDEELEENIEDEVELELEEDEE